MRLIQAEKKQLLQGLGMLTALALIGLLLGQIDWSSEFSEEWLLRHIDTYGWLGYVQFIAIFAGLASVGMPRQIIAFGAGFLFDISLGVVLSTVAVTVGATLTYLIARFLLSHTFMASFFGKQRKIGQFLHQQTFRKTLTIRLLPVGNNMITNLIAGTSRAPMARFLFGSMLGYLPQMVIFALAGSGTSVGSVTQLGLGIGLFVIATLLSWQLYRRYYSANPTDVESLS